MGERDEPTVIRKILVFWKWLARRDVLPETTPGPEGRRRGSSFLSWLFATDSLPHAPPAPSRPRRRPRWLLSAGSLPDPPQRDAAAAPSFLVWLFRPERLPSPPSDPANKEAS